MKRDELARAISNLLQSTREHNFEHIVWHRQTDQNCCNQEVRRMILFKQRKIVCDNMPNRFLTPRPLLDYWLAGQIRSSWVNRWHGLLSLTCQGHVSVDGLRGIFPVRTIYLSVQFGYMLTRSCLYRLRLHNLCQWSCACLRLGTCQMKTPDHILTNKLMLCKFISVPYRDLGVYHLGTELTFVWTYQREN